MADVTTIDNIISAKTQVDYGEKDREDNFIVDNEITVTITLREYRKLLLAEAEARIKEAKDKENTEYWAKKKAEEETANLKKTLEVFKNENLYMRKKLNIGPYDEINLEDDSDETNG